LELHRRTIALRRRALARPRHSTARRAHNSIPQVRDVLLRHQRRLPLAPRAQHTHRLALLATRSTRRRRLVTPLPLRARRPTLVIRGGRLPARHIRLRHPNKTKVPWAYPKCTYGT
jgi:hypothetical protein